MKALFLILPAIVVLSASPLPASVAKAMQFEEKVNRADAVVLGEVLRSTSRFEKGGNWIVTDTTLRVEKSFKGEAPGEIVMTTPGGSIGGLHQQTVGVPGFQEGSERVVFLKRTTNGDTTIVGMAQGTYDVTTSSDGTKLVQPMASDLILVDERNGMVVAAEESRKTLDQFEAAVRNAGDRRPMIQAASSVTARISDPIPVAHPFATFVEENKVILSVLVIGVLLSLIPLIVRKR